MTVEKTKTEIELHIDFLERQLKTLKDMPFIRVNPKDPSQQKTTPAAKQYKELLQQYINLVKAYSAFTETTGQKDRNSDIPEAFRQFLEG